MRLRRSLPFAVAALAACSCGASTLKHGAGSHARAVTAAPATPEPARSRTLAGPPLTTASPITTAAPMTTPAPATKAVGANSATVPTVTPTRATAEPARAAAAPAFTTGAISPATDPAGLAAELTAVETRLHDPRIPSDLLALEALRQQLAYQRLASHPDWLPVVVASLPTQWRATVEANTDAQINLTALATGLPDLQGVRIRTPAPAITLLGYYKQAQAITGVPWHLLAAIHMVESKMSRFATTSVAGAQGPMQFLPSTWAYYGRGDINADQDAILAAARYLQAMGAPGNLAEAVYHYNPSDHYVRAVLAYAAQIQTDPSAFASYYYWQVVVGLGAREVVLPEGYPTVPAIPVS